MAQTLQEAFLLIRADTLIENCLRWQQHALLLHTINIRHGLQLVGLGEDSWHQPQEEFKDSDVGMQMPQIWEPGVKAVFAYKNPKTKDNVMVMRVHELPNGVIEVHMESIQNQNSQDQAALDLKSFVKMIDNHQSYSNLDTWLPQTQFTKQYKDEILGKLVQLPVEQQAQQPQPLAFNGLGSFRPINNDNNRQGGGNLGSANQPYRPPQNVQPPPSLFGAPQNPYFSVSRPQGGLNIIGDPTLPGDHNLIGPSSGIQGNLIGPNSDIFRGGFQPQPGGFMGPNPDLGGNLIGPNSRLFGGPGRAQMPIISDPLLGGNIYFEPEGINDLHPDLPGMGPQFPQNRRPPGGGGFGGGFRGGFGGGSNFPGGGFI